MRMSKIFKLPQNELKRALTNHLKSKGYRPQVQDGFVYAAGSIPVLLIAHMDTVHKQLPTTICSNKEGNIWMSPQGIGGDDRCGVIMILEIIKNLNCHVLFTEDEEIGGVGADKFCRSKIKPEVNFIVEFDRAGECDAVYYQQNNEEFMRAVESYGFVGDYGSYTDIVDIAPELGCAAVNLSCGYYNPHTLHEYVDFSHMYAQIKRAEKLIVSEQDNFYKYSEVPLTRRGVYDWGSWYDDRWLSPKTENEIESDFGTIEVSPIPASAFLQSYEDGGIYEVSDIDDLFVDETGMVFEYDVDELVLIPLYEYIAVDGATGAQCKLDSRVSCKMEVEW